MKEETKTSQQVLDKTQKEFKGEVVKDNGQAIGQSLYNPNGSINPMLYCRQLPTYPQWR